MCAGVKFKYKFTAMFWNRNCNMKRCALSNDSANSSFTLHMVFVSRPKNILETTSMVKLKNNFCMSIGGGVCASPQFRVRTSTIIRAFSARLGRFLLVLLLMALCFWITVCFYVLRKVLCIKFTKMRLLKIWEAVFRCKYHWGLSMSSPPCLNVNIPAPNHSSIKSNLCIEVGARNANRNIITMYLVCLSVSLHSRMFTCVSCTMHLCSLSWSYIYPTHAKFSPYLNLLKVSKSVRNICLTTLGSAVVIKPLR